MKKTLADMIHDGTSLTGKAVYAKFLGGAGQIGSQNVSVFFKASKLFNILTLTD